MDIFPLLLVISILSLGLIWYLIAVMRDPFRGFLILIPFMVITRSIALPIVGERITLFDFMLLLWWLGVCVRAVNGYRDINYSPSMISPSLAYYFFLVACVLSLFSAVDVLDGGVEVTVYIFLGIFGLAVVGIVNSEEDIERISKLLPWVLLVTALLSIWEAILVPRGFPTLLSVRNEERITGTFRNPNQLGSFLVTILPFVWTRLLFSEESRRVWYLLIFTSLAGLFSLVLTVSRASMIVAALQLIVIVFIVLLRSLRGRLKLSVRLVPVLVTLVIGFALVPRYAESYWENFRWRALPMFETMVTTMDVNETLAAIPEGQQDVQIDNWVNSWKAFQDSPIWGVGIANFEKSYTLAGVLGKEVHSHYAGMLAETGIIGFVSIIIFMLIVGYRSVKLLQLSKKKSLILWIVLALFLSIFTNYVGGIYVRILRQRWVWLVIGLTLAYWKLIYLPEAKNLPFSLRMGRESPLLKKENPSDV